MGKTTTAALVLVLMFGSSTEGQVYVQGDLNLDGVVDFDDFLIFAGNFGKTGPALADGPLIVGLGKTWDRYEINGVRSPITPLSLTLNVNRSYVFGSKRGTFDLQATGDGNTGTLVLSEGLDGQPLNLTFLIQIGAADQPYITTLKENGDLEEWADF